MYLKYYYVEADKFKEAAAIKLTHEWGKIIAKKLARHFKVDCRIIERRSRTVGHAWYREIQLPIEPTMLMVCHEIAHLYEQQKRQNRKHNKKLMTTVKRMVQFTLKNWEYWIPIKDY